MKHKIDRGDKPRVDIPWREGIYQINEDGQVRSFWKIWQSSNELAKDPQRLLQPSRKRLKKYWPRAEVTFYNWLHKKRYYVARLVAELFMWLDPKNKAIQVINKDWDWMNCRKDNLELSSVQNRQLRYTNYKYKKNESISMSMCAMKCWWYYETDTIKNIDMNSITKEQLVAMIVYLMEECNSMYEQYDWPLND